MVRTYDEEFWDQYKEVQGSFFATSSKHEYCIIECPHRASKATCETVLEEYYYRPRNKHERESDIVNTVIGEVTKNHIRGRSKGNDSCDKHNGYVAGAKTKDAVYPLL